MRNSFEAGGKLDNSLYLHNTRKEIPMVYTIIVVLIVLVLIGVLR